MTALFPFGMQFATSIRSRCRKDKSFCSEIDWEHAGEGFNLLWLTIWLIYGLKKMKKKIRYRENFVFTSNNSVPRTQNELPIAIARPAESALFPLSSMTLSCKVHGGRTPPSSTGEGGEIWETSDG